MVVRSTFRRIRVCLHSQVRFQSRFWLSAVPGEIVNTAVLQVSDIQEVKQWHKSNGRQQHRDGAKQPEHQRESCVESPCSEGEEVKSLGKHFGNIVR